MLVVNNGMLGTIRMHQERQFGRGVATDLVNPDFVAYAQAFGAHAALVERGEDFPAAFEAALGAGRPALLELRVDPEAITPERDAQPGTRPVASRTCASCSGRQPTSRRTSSRPCPTGPCSRASRPTSSAAASAAPCPTVQPIRTW